MYKSILLKLVEKSRSGDQFYHWRQKNIVMGATYKVKTFNCSSLNNPNQKHTPPRDAKTFDLIFTSNPIKDLTNVEEARHELKDSGRGKKGDGDDADEAKKKLKRAKLDPKSQEKRDQEEAQRLKKEEQRQMLNTHDTLKKLTNSAPVKQPEEEQQIYKSSEAHKYQYFSKSLIKTLKQPLAPPEPVRELSMTVYSRKEVPATQNDYRQEVRKISMRDMYLLMQEYPHLWSRRQIYEAGVRLR